MCSIISNFCCWCFICHNKSFNTLFIFSRHTLRTFYYRFFTVCLMNSRLKHENSLILIRKFFHTFLRCQSGSNLAMVSKYAVLFDQLDFQFSRFVSGLQSIILFANVAFSFETRNNSFRRFSWLRLIQKTKTKCADILSIFIRTFSVHIHYDYRYLQLFA